MGMFTSDIVRTAIRRITSNIMRIPIKRRDKSTECVNYLLQTADCVWPCSPNLDWAWGVCLPAHKRKQREMSTVVIVERHTGQLYNDGEKLMNINVTGPS